MKERRTERIVARFTKTEKKFVRKAATTRRQTITEYIRSTLLRMSATVLTDETMEHTKNTVPGQ